MHDVRMIPMATAGAGLLWIAGAVLLLVGMIGDVWQYAALGIWVSGVGGTLTMRAWACQRFEGEREAFNLGRESVRSIR